MPLDPKKISELMNRQKLSQGQLAERAGMARPNLVRVMTGAHANVTIATADRIAEALGVNLAKIVR